jgi:putative NADPH-quinone reductase
MRETGAKRVLIIDGHPDPRPERFVHHLAGVYRRAAEAGGHSVREIRVAELTLPPLRSAEEFEKGEPSGAVRELQESLRWAEHVVVVFPLWLGAMPAMLKSFFEVVLRPGFAFAYQSKGQPKKLLKGRSARVIVTMGMPGVFYRLVYRAHSLKSLERNILAFVGFSPIRDTVIGNVEGMSADARAELITEIETLARHAE